MDSGMALPGTDSITVEQVFAQQLVKLGGHTTDELVALLDDLAVAEMRHVAGDMLSQSVLTWAQMHRPYDMVEPVLKGFCLSVLFAVHTMHTRVAAAGVAEEEDRLYEGEAFGYVAAFKAEDEVLLVLDKAEQDASARSDALGHRIAVRKLWLKLLIQLGKEGSSDKSVLETTAQLKATLKAVKSTITAEGPRSEGCFPSLTRALSTHAPPRPSGSFNRLQAYEYFEHVVGYLEGICHMSQATSLTELLVRLLTCTYLFQTAFAATGGPLVRGPAHCAHLCALAAQADDVCDQGAGRSAPVWQDVAVQTGLASRDGRAHPRALCAAGQPARVLCAAAQEGRGRAQEACLGPVCPDRAPGRARERRRVPPDPRKERGRAVSRALPEPRTVPPPSQARHRRVGPAAGPGRVGGPVDPDPDAGRKRGQEQSTCILEFFSILFNFSLSVSFPSFSSTLARSCTSTRSA